jgi:hypothetical protein
MPDGTDDFGRPLVVWTSVYTNVVCRLGEVSRARARLVEAVEKDVGIGQQMLWFLKNADVLLGDRVAVRNYDGASLGSVVVTDVAPSVTDRVQFIQASVVNFVGGQG